MSTATVTRSVPSTPAPAASGGPVVPYVSTFEQLLLRGRWAALAVVLIWALGCFWALRSADVATRVIGHDTAPSITAAEGIRSLLADANGELANIMLTSASTSGPFVDAFRSDIAEAEAKLVDAAQNITYGDAEKTPITMIMRGVAEYNELVGEARAVNSAPIALKADDLMRRTILPATEALDQANDDQLTANYCELSEMEIRADGRRLPLRPRRAWRSRIPAIPDVLERQARPQPRPRRGDRDCRAVLDLHALGARRRGQQTSRPPSPTPSIRSMR